LGGSLVFGSYAPNQNSTISEFYSNLMNHRMLNGGVGGHVLKQHLSLYYNYLSKVSVKKIILVFGFNDMTNCYQGKTFNDIRLDIFHKNVDLIYKQPTKELLKIILFKTMDFFKLKKLIFNLKNKTENKMVKYSVFKIEKYCNEVDQALTTFNQFCKNKSIDLCIILQPSLTSSFKKKSLYEENYIKKNLTEERINFSRVFFKNLNSTLKKYENYYNFQNIYDEEEKTIFIDSAHVGDIGNKIFAEKLFYKLNQKKYM